MAKEKNSVSDIHKGHRQRVWRELTKMGIDENTPAHKVLELILFFTIPRKDTNELAHIVLNYFDNSFAKVMEASVEELMASSVTDNKDIPKISEYTASHIKLILEIAKYYYTVKSAEEKTLMNKVEASQFLLKKLVDVNIETVYLLCLDNASRFLACPKIAEGDEFAVAISPRQLVKKVTQIGATKVVIAHNHPRGAALPSAEDINVTKQVAVALSGIGARLVDHIIVADNDFVSLCDSAEYGFIFRI